MIGFIGTYLQLQSIITAHNQWLSKTRSIPYWTTGVFSSTVTDLVLIYESVTSTASTLDEGCLTTDLFSSARLLISLTMENVYCLTDVTERAYWIVAYQWTAASVHCCGNVCLANLCLVMDFRSGSVVLAFRRYDTIRLLLYCSVRYSPNSSTR
jgi:hypothetical protein